jgi:hypothetical protein
MKSVMEINLVEILGLMRLILKNTSPGCFSGKGEKKGSFFFLFLSQKEKRKEKCSCQRGVSRLAGSVQQSYVQQS